MAAGWEWENQGGGGSDLTTQVADLDGRVTVLESSGGKGLWVDVCKTYGSWANGVWIGLNWGSLSYTESSVTGYQSARPTAQPIKVKGVFLLCDTPVDASRQAKVTLYSRTRGSTGVTFTLLPDEVSGRVTCDYSLLKEEEIYLRANYSIYPGSFIGNGGIWGGNYTIGLELEMAA